MLRLAVKRNHSKAIASEKLIHTESRRNCSELPSGPSFVICDSKAKGFPIRHASQGFQDLFGSESEEANELLSPMRLLQSDELKNFAEGLSGHEVSESIHRMARAAEAAQCAVPTVPSSWPLLILPRCSGELLVCDIAWCKNRHPVLGWSYHAVMVRNISEISVARVLVAASKEATYTELCAEWAEMAQDMGLPLVSQKLSSCSEELHAAAQKMWKDELAKGVKPKPTMKRHEEDMSSIWSRSTASTMASSSSKEKKHAKLESEAEATIGSHHLGALIGMLPVADEENMEMEKHEKHEENTQIAASFFEGFESASDEFEDCESMSDGSMSSDGPPLFDEVEDPNLHVDRPHLREMSVAFVLASLSTKEFPIALRSAGVESSAKSWPSGPAMKLKQGSDARQVLEPTQPKAVELWKSFCECFEEQRFFKTDTGGGIALLDGLEVSLPAGELVFVQPFHGRLGNAIDCLVYVKHIELDDCPYLLALYSQLPDDRRLEEEFDRFSSQVDEVISEFASDFFYYAPMRRQRMRGKHTGFAEGCELSSDI